MKIANYWKLVVLEIGSIGNSRHGRDGYTVIELLGVVAILVIVSSIIFGILYSTLRGTSKTNINTVVSQNGSYALSVISNIIIDSRNITQINGADISDCTASPSGTSITLLRLDDSLTTLACEGDPYTITSDSSSLIDTNEVQVMASNCSFTCSQETGDQYGIPRVDVKLTVEDKNTGLFETKASSAFQTSVSLRTYAP